MNYHLMMDLLKSRGTYFFLMGLGVVLFAFFLYEDHQHDKIRGRYKATPCTILSSEVEERVTHGRRGARHYTYHFVVKYAYEVNGKKYSGTKYRHGDSSMSEDEALDVADKFDVGRNTCYVDPDAPENSVLTQESDMRALYAVAAFGILGLLFGVGGWATLEFAGPPAAATVKAQREAKKEEPVQFEIPAWSALGKLQRKDT